MAQDLPGNVHLLMHHHFQTRHGQGFWRSRTRESQFISKGKYNGMILFLILVPPSDILKSHKGAFCFASSFGGTLFWFRVLLSPRVHVVLVLVRMTVFVALLKIYIYEKPQVSTSLFGSEIQIKTHLPFTYISTSHLSFRRAQRFYCGIIMSPLSIPSPLHYFILYP